WQPLRRQVNGGWIETEQQWAEVCFVPNRVGRSKQGPSYRFIAIREPLLQKALPGMEGQQTLPFPTMEFASGSYKLFGIVTNRDLPGEELIHWHRGRCGKSEEAHGIMKEDFSGGKLPSGDFGENAAWWWIMILALNLNEAMKRLVLGGSWATKRMKAIRFALINIPAWVRERSRQLRVRLSQGHPSLEILVGMRQKIMKLAEIPSG
ncbi:MAG TPA: transposase, partial [Candidatus Manganitrophaceae bacterium]|nr:transposase [Candidatus Manganitrophaceae bacterium]